MHEVQFNEFALQTHYNILSPFNQTFSFQKQEQYIFCDFDLHILFLVACNIFIFDMACVGGVRVHIPRKILGKQQYGT